jgi:hypothetical protein
MVDGTVASISEHLRKAVSKRAMPTGSKGEKRPADMIGAAIMVATGAEENQASFRPFRLGRMMDPGRACSEPYGPNSEASPAYGIRRLSRRVKGFLLVSLSATNARFHQV